MTTLTNMTSFSNLSLSNSSNAELRLPKQLLGRLLHLLVLRQTVIISGETGSGALQALEQLSRALPCNSKAVVVEHRTRINSLPAGSIKLAGSRISSQQILEAATLLQAHYIILGYIRDLHDYKRLLVVHKEYGGALAMVYAGSAAEAIEHLRSLDAHSGAQHAAGTHSPRVDFVLHCDRQKGARGPIYELISVHRHAHGTLRRAS